MKPPFPSPSIYIRRIVASTSPVLAIAVFGSTLLSVTVKAGVVDADQKHSAYSPVVTFARVKESTKLREGLYRISFSDARFVAYSSTALLVGLRATIEHLTFTDADGTNRYVWWVVPPAQK